MSCNSCSSNGLPKGCKNNGLCGVSGCNKLNVIDWLGNIKPASDQTTFQGVEVRFKNGRKEFFMNEKQLHLYIGDVVVTERNPGYDVGIVSLTGDLVKVQMKKKQQHFIPGSILKIERKATNTDIEKWDKAKARESDIMFKARKIALNLNLEMKISDVEFQGDGKKVIFYYTAEGRVEFSELEAAFANDLKAIITEMKQIGMRQEASRLGGIGSCGRELCCSTWLTDFRSVSTSAARYQQLSLNPEKLAGQCGKLKCCLNYELDSYVDALKEFPSPETKLKTKSGVAFFQKMDVFKRLVTYSYETNPFEFFSVELDQVKEIISLNKRGELADDIAKMDKNKMPELFEFKDVVGQESLTRFDRTKKKGKKRRKGKKPNSK